MLKQELILGVVALCVMLGLTACQAPSGGLPLGKPQAKASDPLFRIEQAGKWGFINQQGVVVIEPTYADLPDAVTLLGQLGFTPDTFSVTGDTVSLPSNVMLDPALSQKVIQLQSSDILGFYFDFASQSGIFNRKRVPVGKFAEGRAAVNVDGQWGFIDTAGRMVIKPQYDRVDAFAEGFAPVLKDGDWFYINREGDDVFKKKFDAAFGFREALARVRLKGKWNYIDPTGSDVLQTPLDYAADFSDGLAFVKGSGKVGYIDKNGQFKITLDGVKLGGLFKSDMAPVMSEENKWGFIDTEGTYVIQPLYDDADSFSGGLAAVRMENLYGFIDPAGTLIITPQFNTLFPFSGGLAAVKSEGRWGYINTQGDFVVQPAYEWAYPFKDGLAAVEGEDGLMYIDTTGKPVWRPKQ